MLLKKLMYNCQYQVICGSVDIEISCIAHHTKDVVPGSLYLCMKGYKTDGHIYVEEAIAKGAIAVVVDEITQDIIEKTENVTLIEVADSRKVLSKIASNFYESPTDSVKLVGITGTNGKTSTAYLIYYILKNYSKKVGLIGTIENRIGDKVTIAERTTEDALELQKIFGIMADNEVECVVMEVSSHALALHRVDTCSFNIGVFTNISHDHMDFHETISRYSEAKEKLFKMCEKAVINIDDGYGAKFANAIKADNCMTYSCNKEDADIRATNIKMTLEGATFDCSIEGKVVELKIQTPGKFSVYNALAAIGACCILGVPIPVIKEGLEKYSTVKGRFQSFKLGNGGFAIVDYAHTPDGLENVLKTVHEIDHNRIITVFGCGGDRDRSKRREMGSIAASYSDYVIITSDNPRTEDPDAIINDILKGIDGHYKCITNRKEAIIEALNRAEKDDIVLIAGKGHEDYQIIGNRKIHFSDIEIVESYI